MSWLFFAFSGPVLWAASVHIDKYIVEKYFKEGSVAVLMVFTAIIGLIALPFIWIADQRVAILPLQSIAVIVSSGVLYMGAMYFYLQALQSEDASTVAPLFQSMAIFGFILGFLFLKEIPTSIQLTGGLLIIIGSVILSVQRGERRHRMKTRLILLMLACSFALALSALIFKFFAITDEFWSTTFWNFVGNAIFGVLLMMSAANRRQFKDMFKTNPGAVLTINGINEVVNLAGSLGTRYALIFAPLGIVQAIGSTTLFFVLLFGILLSFFFPKISQEEIGGKNILKKAVAVTLVVAGVWLVNR